MKKFKYIWLLLFTSAYHMQGMQQNCLTPQEKKRRNSFSIQDKIQNEYETIAKKSKNTRLFTPTSNTPLTAKNCLTPYWINMKKAGLKKKALAQRIFIYFYRKAKGAVRNCARLDIMAATIIGAPLNLLDTTKYELYTNERSYFEKPTRVTSAQNNALFQAVVENDYQLASMLLLFGASTQLTFDHALPSILFLARTKRMANLLLYHHADPTIVDQFNATILHNVVAGRESHSIDLIDVYSKKINIHEEDTFGRTALEQIIYKYYDNITDTLGLAKPFDIEPYIHKFACHGADIKRAHQYASKLLQAFKKNQLVDSSSNTIVVSTSNEKVFNKKDVVKKLENIVHMLSSYLENESLK